MKKRKRAAMKAETRVRTYSGSSSSDADDRDTGFSLLDDEALALKLLTS